MIKIKEILEERGNNYGDFKSNSALAQHLKDVIRNSPSWVQLSSYQKEALEMVVHKMARILNGNPEYKDSWTDIIGYVQLVIDELDKNKS